MEENNDRNVIQLKAAKLARDTNTLSASIRGAVEAIAGMHDGRSVEWIDEKSAVLLEVLLEMRKASTEPLCLRFRVPMQDADIQSNEREVTIWTEKVLERCGNALLARITQLLGP